MVSEKSIKVGILTGPTATGKTGLALQLAFEHGNIEIINADSLLVYREMNIGTAKPSTEELDKVRHHLIDIRNPNEPFTAGEFFRATHAAIDDIHQRGKRALIVGGTGFYLNSLIFGLWEAPAADIQLRDELSQKENTELYNDLLKIDPTSAHRIGPADRYRLIRSLELYQLTGKSPTDLQNQVSKNPDPRFQLWIIDRDSNELNQRIQIRTEEMIQNGLVEEYQKLQAQYPNSRSLSAVGYAQVAKYIKNEIPNGRKVKPGLIGLSDEIQLATRQLVKTQRTWFKGQKKRVPNSESFYLDGDLEKLQAAFTSTYKG